MRINYVPKLFHPLIQNNFSNKYESIFGHPHPKDLRCILYIPNCNNEKAGIDRERAWGRKGAKKGKKWLID